MRRALGAHGSYLHDGIGPRSATLNSVDATRSGAAEPPDAEGFRDILAVIDSSVYLLRKRLGDDPDALRHLERILAHVARGVEWVQALEEARRVDECGRRISPAPLELRVDRP